MATGTISKRSIDALHPGDKDRFLWDAGEGSVKGLGLKVTPSGKKVFLFQYRVPWRSTPIRMMIGEHGGFDGQGRPWTADRARKEAERLRGAVSAGRDPVADRKAAAKAEAAAAKAEAEESQRLATVTVRAMADMFLKRVRDKRPASERFYEPNLRLHVLSVIGDIPLPEVTQADALRVIESIPAQQPALRRSVFATARALWNWSARLIDLPDRSPFDRIEAPTPPMSRDRVLTDDELALALRAARKLPMPFGPFYELAFATGQRREEVAGINWTEIDREAALWTLPGSRTKNGKVNLVPLNRHALAALDRAAAEVTAGAAIGLLEKAASKAGNRLSPEQREAAASESVRTALAEYRSGARKWPSRGFVLSGTGESPVSGYSRAKARLDATMLAIARDDAEAAGEDPESVELTPWRLHDARRTLATGLQRLGVRFEVTEAVLNHTSGASRSGVAAVYQRHDWGPEKRAALDAWADHCDRVLNPGSDIGNVVPLRQGG